MPKMRELTDAQWQEIKDLLPGKAGDRGRTARDNRAFVNGVLWMLRSGAYWRHMPERYGNWKSAHKRFTRWARAEVREEVFDVLTENSDNEYLMIDTTIVRTHRQAATGKGDQRRGSGAFPRRFEYEDSYDDRRLDDDRRLGPPLALHTHGGSSQ